MTRKGALTTVGDLAEVERAAGEGDPLMAGLEQVSHGNPGMLAGSLYVSG
jgi:hypothetical protein